MSNKVLEYEKFLNDVLREDLKKVLEERDKLCSQVSEYLQLKTVIERLQEEELCESKLKTKVDLGCNFYVQAVVPDTKYIFVHVGFGFCVQFTLEEAVKFIEKKINFLQKELEKLSKTSAEIKAHIKVVLEGLRELQNIDPKSEERRLDIW